MKPKKSLRLKFKKFAQNKYTHLLSSLIVLLLFASLFDRRFVVGQTLISFGFLSTTILVLRTFYLSKKIKIYFNILALLTFVFTIVNNIFYVQKPTFFLSIITFSLYSIFISIAIIFMTVRIFKSKKVTGDTLKGGISIYLMIGLLWYIFYELILLIDVDAFSIQIEDLETYKLVYFSYTTLTSLGYGDISPLNKLAMALANLEAIIGQMYPAIFIARLVTLYDSD